MALVQQNFPAYLRTIRIIFIALLMSQLMVLIVLYIVRGSAPPAPAADQKLWTRYLPFVLVLLPMISLFLYRKKLATARVQVYLPEKLNTYRTALLLRWAPLEGMNLFLAAVYFLTGQVFLLYGAIVLIAIVASQWPTRSGIVASLGLSSDEQAILDDPHATVSEISQRS